MRHFKKNAVLVAITAALTLTGGGIAAADSGTHGSSLESSGFLSGNVIQLPIHVPFDLCGNTLNVIGLLNPAFGSECGSGSAHQDEDWAVEGYEHEDNGGWEEPGCPADEFVGYECAEEPNPEPTGGPMPEPTDHPSPEPTATPPAPALSVN